MSPRKSNQTGAKVFDDPVAASTLIERGHLVMLNSAGNAVNVSAATGLKARGVCMAEADNSAGAAGDIRVHTEAGVYGFDNSAGGDEITAADINQVCYAVSGSTVAKTSNGNTRSPAGRVVRVHVNGRVDVQIDGPVLANGDLLAANNLSDVGSAATARENIAANLVWVHAGQVSTKAADAGVLRVPAMDDGTLLMFKTVINGALATADATVQAKIAGSNAGSTTTGLVTITQAGSAAGDVDTASPVTTNVTFTEGQVISFHVAGGSTATGTADVFALIKY